MKKNARDKVVVVLIGIVAVLVLAAAYVARVRKVKKYLDRGFKSFSKSAEKLGKNIQKEIASVSKAAKPKSKPVRKARPKKRTRK